MVTSGFDLVVMPEGGGARRSLLASSPHVVSALGAPAWTPDGLWIVAPMSVDGIDGLFAVPTDGSGRLGRVAANLSGMPANSVGAVVFPDPFPDVHWELDVKAAGPTVALSNPLDLPANTLDGWLGGITSDIATFFRADEATGSFVAVDWFAPGPWSQNPGVPTGGGGQINSEPPVAFASIGKLARPHRMDALPRTFNYFGMRAPQVADFETMFGFAPPEGTAISRIVDGQSQIVTFGGGLWRTASPQGTLVTVPPPVAEVAEAWLVQFGAPGIHGQPADARVTLGTPAQFHVDAVGVPPLKYRWHRAGDASGDLGATGDTLSIGAVRNEDLGEYRVEITDVHGTASSRAARLSAEGPLRIVSATASPGNPVPLGSDVTLAVTAVGSGTLTYQWFRNGLSIPDETSSTLVLHSAQPATGGAYTVRVTDAAGTLFGGPIPVLPDIPPGPFSDGFLALQPGIPGFTNAIAGDSGVARGSNATATSELGEPLIAGAPAHNSIWVSWVPATTGIATLDTAGSSFDTRLAVFRAPAADSPSLSNIVLAGGNDDADVGTHTSRVRVDVVAGTRYFVAVDGAALQRGTVVLSWGIEPTVQHVPRIISQSTSPNALPGQPLLLSVAVAPSVLVQTAFTWFRDGTAVPGAISGNLDLGSASIAVVGKYFADIRQTYADGTSQTTRSVPVDVQLYQRSNGSDPAFRAFDRLGDVLAQTGAGGGHAAALARSPRPVGLSRGVSGTQVFSTVGETVDPNEPTLCGAAGGASKWYPLTCDADGVVTVDTQGSTFDTVLAVFYDTGESEDPYLGMREVACNNDISGAEKTSSVSFCARAGNIYLVAVDGVGGASGIVQLHYAMSNADPKPSCPGPTIVCASRPARRVATQGTTVVLSARVGGTEPLELSWYHGATLVQKGPSASLVLPNVGVADAGTYTLRVSNDDGMTQRETASLAIATGDQPLLGYTPECDGSITFEIAGAKNTAYVVESSADLVAWTPLFTGSSTNGVQRLPVLDAGATAGKTFRARKF